MGAAAGEQTSDAGAQPTAPTAPATPSEPKSLLQPGKGEAKAPAADPAAPTVTAPSQGAWPDSIPDQFRRSKLSETISQEHVTETGEIDWKRVAEKAAESWKETKTALQSKHAALGAPKAGEDGKVHYEIKMPEGVAGISAEDLKDDPLWKRFEERAAKHNLSQEVVNEILGDYIDETARDNVHNAENEVRMLRLAGYSDAKLAEVGAWWQAWCDTPDQFADLQAMALDHRGFLTLDRIRNKILGTRMITEPSRVTTPADADAQWEERMKDQRNYSDPAFAAETDAMGKRLHGDR